MDGDFGQAHGVRRCEQSGGVLHPVGEALGDRGDRIGALQDGSDGDEAGHPQADQALHHCLQA